jgi:hypothetical protein
VIAGIILIAAASFCFGAISGRAWRGLTLNVPPTDGDVLVAWVGSVLLACGIVLVLQA